ncbi:hypothetical protein [Halococcus sp. IIIV-5B]|nr:hypothetical protein [Halococcus sp. IIIV-5B]
MGKPDRIESYLIPIVYPDVEYVVPHFTAPLHSRSRNVLLL